MNFIRFSELVLQRIFALNIINSNLDILVVLFYKEHLYI